MVKPYYDNDRVIHSVNVVSSESDKDKDKDKDDVDIGELSSLSATSKLNNSDVLHNLDSKLSHLQPNQRQDLQNLVKEFEHLFPDIPTRTDKIFNDDDVGDAKPVKQHPYGLNPVKQKYLREEVQY